MAATSERATSCIVRPYCPARSRSMFDLQRRIVLRLGKLQIAKERQLRELGPHFRRVRPVVRQARTLNGNLDRCRRAGAHHLVDDVAGFERDRDMRQSSCASFCAQPLSECRRFRGELPA